MTVVAGATWSPATAQADVIISEVGTSYVELVNPDPIERFLTGLELRYASADAPGSLSARSAPVCPDERRSRGAPALRADARLQRAANAHAQDMLRRRYFSHQRRGGPDLAARVRRTGLRFREVGENIGLGGDVLGSPRELVRGWMASPPHRANLLRRSYRLAGIAVLPGSPLSRGRAATGVTVFGR